MLETLREKAAKKIKGPNANPSQLGDPISIKAEQSDNVPTEDEKGAADTPQSVPPGSEERKKRDEGNGGRDGATLREKAVGSSQGSKPNPTQLGDPISLKAERTDDDPTSSEEGAHKSKKSKL